MLNNIKTRLAREESGFTLIELLVVIVILGILVAIAVPSYLSFRGNAEGAAAESNVRSAIPAAEGYYQANDGTNTDADSNAATTGYDGMTAALMAAQAPGVQINTVNVSLDKKAYCIDFTKGQHSAYYIGGDQDVNSDGAGFQALAGTAVVAKVTGTDSTDTCDDATVGATAGS